ncbi:MAG: cytochrome d ubiquinol oxidase subunit II [Muribaculaceae bacterium]|nr:cytochrome d ubiquinol oxidase subunit II [Muribaculaceae bacterium]
MNELQIYWWAIVSLLGALLVFLLFVQGGQTYIGCVKNEQTRNLIVNSLGRKWELTFTTLVVYGGAFFASFPLFYSTSFGGAYWLWMLILLSFILQAVSYEFRRKPGNIFGERVYDIFLMFNGCVGCVLLGVVVGTLFFGADFSVTRGNLLDGSAPVISQWNGSHGLEAIASWRNLLLGFMVLFLARTLAALYFINSIDDGAEFAARMRKSVIVNGGIFVVLFLAFAAVLLTSSGYGVNESGVIEKMPYKYVSNLTNLWWLGLMLLAGVLCVLWGIVRTALPCKGVWRCGIWWTGIGTVLTVFALLCAAGYNGTAYLPSVSDPSSSLTIANSSSTHFTLKVMAWVSAFVPVVVAYIGYVWYKMNARPLTTEEVENDHSY